MSKLFIALSISLGLGLLNTNTSLAGEAYYDWEAACTIRNDKFKFVLPKAMRRHNIDMWIVIYKGRGTEPLAKDFGDISSNGATAYVFTDRGEDGIERAIIGHHSQRAVDCGAYELFSEQSLGEFVAERDPQRIGINVSTENNLFPMEGRHLVDGLSHRDFINLQKELGEKYAARLVSAERVAADFRAERVASELFEMAKVADTNRKLIERALSNEVITPGVTTQGDVMWWLEEQREKLGLERGWFPTVFVSQPNGEETADENRVITRGDVIQIDWGAGDNNFHTDLKRFAYVLKENETKVPEYIQKSFENARKIREIIQDNVQSGQTGRELLDNLKDVVRKAGYVYTEDESANKKAKGIEVNIGMHGAGNLGHEAGGSLFEIYPERTKYDILPDHIISVEFIAFTPAKEWRGNKVPVCIEENAVITHRGVEWLHPPQNKVLVIR